MDNSSGEEISGNHYIAVASLNVITLKRSSRKWLLLKSKKQPIPGL
jgi:hypothetical protein